jgi:hypothetical protein
MHRVFHREASPRPKLPPRARATIRPMTLRDGCRRAMTRNRKTTTNCLNWVSGWRACSPNSSVCCVGSTRCGIWLRWKCDAEGRGLRIRRNGRGATRRLIAPRGNVSSVKLKLALPIFGPWTPLRPATRASIQSATRYCRSRRARAKVVPSEKWRARFGWANGVGEAFGEFANRPCNINF